MSEIGFRAAPTISEELLSRCRADDDFREAAFEWYKHVGILAVEFANLKDTGGMKPIGARNLAALKGLLMRCAKLMRANSHLSRQRGGSGEATTILDRSIVESAVKVRWLCQHGTEERFSLFIADGLKTELRLKKVIEENIAARGHVTVIEHRMLASIASTILASGVTDDEILNTKPVPDYASMLQILGVNPLNYIVYQRIGSHAVHGTWAALLLQYLREDDNGTLVPRDIDLDTHINQFTVVALAVLDAMESFATFIAIRYDTLAALKMPIEASRVGILEIHNEAAGSDFAPI